LLEFRLSQGKTTVVVPEGNTALLDFLGAAGFSEFNNAVRMTLGKEADWRPPWFLAAERGTADSLLGLYQKRKQSIIFIDPV